MSSCPYVFAVSGIKNSGKTTFIEALIPYFRKKGLQVGVLKHDGHTFQADVEDTDSWKYLKAGASKSLVFDSEKYMFTSMVQVSASDLLPLFHDCDLVILEGFKHGNFSKYEIVRFGNSESNVCSDRYLCGVISDFIPNLSEDVPLFSLNDPEAFCEHICSVMSVPQSGFYADTKAMLFHDHYFFGPGVSMLLKEILNQGSIRKAAITMNMSYSKAWKMIKRLEEETEKEFLIRNTGGKKGGSSVLTDTAFQFLNAYESFEKEVKQQTDYIFHKYFDTLL